jgi:predicted nucleic acid-binding protein
MTDLLFVDTNLLIYSLDPANPGKRASAVNLIAASFAAGTMVTSPQCLNECYRVLTRKALLIRRDEARAFVVTLLPTCRAPLDGDTIALAWDVESRTGYDWWDSLLLAAALLARCRYFLSEDLQDGRVIDGLTILNPFDRDIRPLLG